MASTYCCTAGPRRLEINNRNGYPLVSDMETHRNRIDDRTWESTSASVNDPQTTIVEGHVPAGSICSTGLEAIDGDLLFAVVDVRFDEGPPLVLTR